MCRSLHEGGRRCPGGNHTPATPTRTHGQTVADSVTATYHELATVPHDWVPIRELRARNPHVPRAEFDAELMRLYMADRINIVPETDQQRLTPEDDAAAIRIGGKNKHLFTVTAPIGESL